MEPRAHHVLIGLFTVIGVAAAVLFSLWLGRGGDERVQRYFVVVFNEGVRGLSNGSAVNYNGIRVGDVARLSLDPADPRRVLARIRVGADAPMKTDTKARLALAGITGNTVIDLSGGAPTSPPLTAPSGQDPIIVASPSAHGRLLESGEDLLSNIAELVVSARQFLSSENAQRLSRTLERIEQASGMIAAQGQDVSLLLKELVAASRDARTTLAKAQELLASTNTVVQKDGAAAVEAAKRAMASVESAGAKLEKLVADNESAVNAGAQGLKELGPAVREAREALASLRVITRRLQDNPANFLLGRERIEEFKP